MERDCSMGVSLKCGKVAKIKTLRGIEGVIGTRLLDPRLRAVTARTVYVGLVEGGGGGIKVKADLPILCLIRKENDFWS